MSKQTLEVVVVLTSGGGQKAHLPATIQVDAEWTLRNADSSDAGQGQLCHDVAIRGWPESQIRMRVARGIADALGVDRSDLTVSRQPEVSPSRLPVSCGLVDAQLASDSRHLGGWMVTSCELQNDLEDLRDDLDYGLRVVNSRLRWIEVMFSNRIALRVEQC